jgi:hypothetical protein
MIINQLDQEMNLIAQKNSGTPEFIRYLTIFGIMLVFKVH